MDKTAVFIQRSKFVWRMMFAPCILHLDWQLPVRLQVSHVRLEGRILLQRDVQKVVNEEYLQGVSADVLDLWVHDEGGLVRI